MRNELHSLSARGGEGRGEVARVSESVAADVSRLTSSNRPSEIVNRKSRKSPAFLLLLILQFAFFISRAPAADADGICDCPKVIHDNIAHFNTLLTLTAPQQKKAASRHFPFGRPAAATAHPHERLLPQTDYLIWYDDDLRDPLWVSYRLTKTDLLAKLTRTNCFRADPRLPAAAASTCDDYDEHTFDRGHLCPNADMERSIEAMINTYLFSNMTPQFSNFNRGIWETLESHTRVWAKTKGELFVISGAIFDKNGDGQRDADTLPDRVKPLRRVAIPTHFYKILIHKRTFGGDEVLAFLLPHNDVDQPGGAAGDAYLAQHLVRIKDIAARAGGVNFFPKAVPTRRTFLENTQPQSLWPLH